MATPIALAAWHPLMPSSIARKSCMAHCGIATALPTRPAGSGKRRLRGSPGDSLIGARDSERPVAIASWLSWIVLVNWKGCEPACVVGAPPSDSACSEEGLQAEGRLRFADREPLGGACARRVAARDGHLAFAQRGGGEDGGDFDFDRFVRRDSARERAADRDGRFDRAISRSCVDSERDRSFGVVGRYAGRQLRGRW